MTIQRRPHLAPIDCPVCGDTFKPKNSRQKYDTLNCAAHARGQRNTDAARKRHNGDTYRYLDRGAWYRIVDGKRIAEARIVYEETHGVKLESWHYVTHVNGDRADNSPDNLRLRNEALDRHVRANRKLPGRMTCVKCRGSKTVVSTARDTNVSTYGCKPCDNARQRRQRVR